MKTKLAKPSLKRETLVRLEDMRQIAGGLRLHRGANTQIEFQSHPCTITGSC